MASLVGLTMLLAAFYGQEISQKRKPIEIQVLSGGTIMNSSQFEKAKGRISEYFKSKKKWKTNEDGELLYYKGKRNLDELEFVLQLAIGGDLDVISKDYCRNAEGKIIGGFITGKIFVDADFNGWNQGTGGADIFIRFTLCESIYYIEQSGTLESLIRSVEYE